MLDDPQRLEPAAGAVLSPPSLDGSDDHPLRAELLSSEQLKHHFRGLAAWHRLGGGRRWQDPLLRRLEHNARVLEEVYHGISHSAGARQRLAPAAEWLLDNHYLIEEQIRIARRHLPRSYSRELPKLGNGPLAGFARTYALAYELILHVDARVDGGSLAAAIGAYQELQPLRLGELWSIPIMLRLALIENLRRVAVRVGIHREYSQRAERWAERLLELAEHRPTELVIGLADLSRSMGGTLHGSFVTDLARRIQGRHHGMGLVLSWLEQRLGEHGGTIDQLVQAENQAQAADQVSVGHSITSLRMLGAVDWREFVESQSVVERILRKDPAGVYARMDFTARDRYRHAIETIARARAPSEAAVAQACIELAAAADAAVSGGRRRHCGWWLIGGGRGELERRLHARPRLGTRCARAMARYALGWYLLVLVAGSVLTAWAIGRLLAHTGIPRWEAAVAALPAALVASQALVQLMNWLCTLLRQPEPLPRMDFTAGIPPECRTLVVVPCMLTDAPTVDRLLDHLEVRWVGNRDPQVALVLLSDFADAPQATLPEDEALLARACDGIERLNARWGTEDHPRPFVLLHRTRVHCPREGVWMGWERKRGKLLLLMRALRQPWEGALPPGFAAGSLDRAWASQVRSVVVADADTQLPLDAVRHLSAAMAHPLNRPEIDARRRVVHLGHGLLQPRVGIALPSAMRSPYARLAAAEPGIDPYTRTVSDLYQDLFDEGSFVGKGIIDVDAFLGVLDGRLPEERVLSHDLLEGCYLRSGLLSDVELFEDTPSTYLADSGRRHRWIRGDWQIASWVWPRVPVPGGHERNPLSPLSQWKLLDNLRRSLVPPALVAVVLVALLRPALPLLWLPLAAWLLEPCAGALADLLRRPLGLSLAEHLRAWRGRGLRQAAQVGFGIVTTLHEALTALDAIVRTLGRLAARRHLLVWRTAADAERDARGGIAGTARAFGPSVVIAVAALATLVHRHAGAWSLGIGVVLLGSWMVAPLLSWWVGQARPEARLELSPLERTWLRLRGRRIWRWYETFPTAEHHHLPPDNYQEHPVAVVAPRTSPTNIGLGLLCQLGAYDFGWLSHRDLLERTARLLETTARLERFRGHLYNWYDTRTLKPLPPTYISTVDSGNFVGCLIVLAQGLEELATLPPLTPAHAAGIADALGLVAEDGGGEGAWAQALARTLAPAPASAGEWPPLLARVRQALDAHAAQAEPWPLAACRQLVHALQADYDELLAWAADPALERLAPETRARLRQATASLAGLAQLGDEPPALTEELGEAAAPLALRIAAAAASAEDRLAQLRALAAQARELASCDFTFLYDRSRNLFTIGYNTAAHRCDDSFYDLLASEARLASFIAVAQGQVRQEHWFALGRMLAAPQGAPALLSWSGSMFEYLMPVLLMPDHPQTILHSTYRAVVSRQVAYGAEHRVPWGVSECGYNATDAHLNYQYRAFGVPGLGLKRGLGQDLVIAPYASVMAVMIAPKTALENLRRLAAEGREGPYGFYEAIDYTPSRLPPGSRAAVVRSWMAHHQGMALLALAQRLLGAPMQRRFLADPLFRAADVLLHEKVPKAQPTLVPHADDAEPRRSAAAHEPLLRIFTQPHTPQPEVHLLSNGRYQVVVSASGAGLSRWRDIAVLRWREDWTRDAYGQFIYLRDREDGRLWSAGYQPCGGPAGGYEAVFTQGRAEFKRTLHGISSTLEVAVSPEDDVEVRRVTLSNLGDQTRLIEVTTYGEVVLAPQAQEVAHPAFANLFVTTELLPGTCAILCTRRPRSAGERPPWMFHLLSVEGRADGEVSFETSRPRFLGPRGSVAAPLAFTRDHLENTAGSVLDPIIAIRRGVRIEPDTAARVDIVTGVAETREGALALIERYRERRLAERVFEMAWTHSQVVLRQLGISEAAAQLYGRLAGSVLYPTTARRAEPAILEANRRGQSGLWGYGISGDLPIVVLRVEHAERLEIVEQVAQAHAYWRIKGLAVDLVILVEDRSVYRQPLHEEVLARLQAVSGMTFDRPGGAFVRRVEQIAPEDRTLILASARVVLADARGSIAEQLEGRRRPDILPPRLVARGSERSTATAWRPGPRELVLRNGLGGFTPDGREYVFTVGPGQVPPAPWCNVIANPLGGTVIDEGGAGYTWVENCHEYRLSTWHNDAVTRTGGEALYLRDDENGAVWSPAPWPAGAAASYLVRHGFGYSVWEHERDGIASELTVFVPMDARARLQQLVVRNTGDRPRRISIAAYVELVLGDARHRNAPSIVTALDAASGVLVATNPHGAEFGSWGAACACSLPTKSVSGDRLEFLGRNGSYALPQALARQRLSGRLGPGLDPCFACMGTIELAGGESRTVVLVLAGEPSAGQAVQTAARFATVEASRSALEAVWAFWKDTLGIAHAQTPEPALDLLLNGWLVYQVLASRLWARSGFYQSGGAYGFRDQLQDVLALLHAQPALARAQLLRAAAHQFVEGDVLHWWHPPQDRGVRTQFSDDFLWLPWATARYVAATGDQAVLEERAAFLEGPALHAHEEARYDLWPRSAHDGTLYDHCLRALRRGLRFGSHGMPLIGCGDWNDGMNRVGVGGRGESGWLAFFLCDCLARFLPLAQAHGDAATVRELDQARRDLAARIDAQLWDGAWYTRAFFDDGTPLGSHTNAECQIDSLPQSWAVLAHATDPERAQVALASAAERLVDERAGIIRLFDPPFDKSALDPGYIKGYVPGVRENGGQYTHAAVWLALALAEAGHTERAWQLARMILPTTHAHTEAGVQVYQAEPYVVAADVYAVPPHTGRGGWTWYTGSAGWLYRLLLEELLGVTLIAGQLRFRPRPPRSWTRWWLHYRCGRTFYHCEFLADHAASGAGVAVTLDGEALAGDRLRLEDDGRDHQVRVLYACALAQVSSS